MTKVIPELVWREMAKDNLSLRSLRNLYSIKDILGMEKKVIVCPLPFHNHASHTPSFSVYTNRDGHEAWHCFGSCSKVGDVVDLIGYMAVGEKYNPASPGDVSKAIEMLIRGYKISPPEKHVSKPKTESLSYDLWKAFPLGDPVIEYAKARGLTANTLQAFGVGQADKSNRELFNGASWLENEIFMTMPTFHYGRLVGIKMRNIHSLGKRNRFMQFPGSSPGMFGMANIASTGDPVAIVKGEISVMNLWQRGITRVAAPNCGEGMVDPKWGIWTSWSRNAIVIGDNDPDPIKRQLSNAYKKRCEIFKAKLHYPPEQFPDVDDWILAFSSAIQTIEGWML